MIRFFAVEQIAPADRPQQNSPLEHSMTEQATHVSQERFGTNL